MLLEELHKKKKLTIKKIQNQQGQDTLELTVKTYHPNTGEELEPQTQATGTKEQMEAQKVKFETELANVEFLLKKF